MGGRDPGRGKIIADTGRLADEATPRSIPAKHAALAAVILAQLAGRGGWAALSELEYAPRVRIHSVLDMLRRRGYIEIEPVGPPRAQPIYRYCITAAGRAALEQAGRPSEPG